MRGSLRHQASDPDGGSSAHLPSRRHRLHSFSRKWSPSSFGAHRLAHAPPLAGGRFARMMGLGRESYLLDESIARLWLARVASAMAIAQFQDGHLQVGKASRQRHRDAGFPFDERFWCPLPDSNRHSDYSETDFKSVASTIPPSGHEAAANISAGNLSRPASILPASAL